MAKQTEVIFKSVSGEEFCRLEDLRIYSRFTRKDKVICRVSIPQKWGRSVGFKKEAITSEEFDQVKEGLDDFPKLTAPVFPVLWVKQKRAEPKFGEDCLSMVKLHLARHGQDLSWDEIEKLPGFWGKARKALRSLSMEGCYPANLVHRPRGEYYWSLARVPAYQVIEGTGAHKGPNFEYFA